MTPFVPPTFKLDAFNCPHCNAYSNQYWASSKFAGDLDTKLLRARCTRCLKMTYWHDEKMIFPDINGFPPPNSDLGDEIIANYLEASSIMSRSPRGAAALIRLAIQKLCVKLGEKGKNINEDIAELVKKGLSPQVQKMLDIVRVVGNNAVHPGQIDLDDGQDTVIVLAKLINEICSEMITKPRELEELYNSLPITALKAIEKRDK